MSTWYNISSILFLKMMVDQLWLILKYRLFKQGGENLFSSSNFSLAGFLVILEPVLKYNYMSVKPFMTFITSQHMANMHVITGPTGLWGYLWQKLTKLLLAFYASICWSPLTVHKNMQANFKITHIRKWTFLMCWLVISKLLFSTALWLWFKGIKHLYYGLTFPLMAIFMHLQT